MVVGGSRAHRPARHPRRVHGHAGGGPANLDVLVRGTLLAQATVAMAPATAVGHRVNVAWPALAVTSTFLKLTSSDGLF